MGVNVKILKIYRISDHSNPEKIKPAYGDKETCLKTLVREFGKEDFYLLADNVSEQTHNMTKQYCDNVQLTNNGNTGSFLYSWNLANELTKDWDEKSLVYLVEDDYIHRRGAKKIMMEGFTELNADYLTLYDHPDKYQDKEDNRFQHGHGRIDLDENGIRKPKNVYVKGEGTVLYCSTNCHWKLTSSTTMTFATTVKNIREDHQLMKDLHTGKQLPMGGLTFKSLAQRDKALISSVPAYTTHAEERWLSYFVNWEEEANA
tara:strand:+ start:7343 stop:8122 length:780 start_codon:yes stop_codon:yes gene_type:complete